VVNITIRDIPPAVRDEIARRAKMRGQSSQEFLKALLQGLTERRDKTEVLRRIDERRASLPNIDVASLIERRDDGRY
jgi:antitoxin FitA